MMPDERRCQSPPCENSLAGMSPRARFCSRPASAARKAGLLAPRPVQAQPQPIGTHTMTSDLSTPPGFSGGAAAFTPRDPDQGAAAPTSPPGLQSATLMMVRDQDGHARSLSEATPLGPHRRPH